MLEGKVAEWPNVPDSKSGVPQGTVGSNPTLSAETHAGMSGSQVKPRDVLLNITGAFRQGLSHSDLGLIRIPFPKLPVQRQIVGKIEQHDVKHHNIYTGIKSQIATLTAYRKSLIHECVTGQRRITEADLRRAQNRSDPHE